MLELENAYRRLIGRKLDALAWRPMRADTPCVAAELCSSTLEFTGAISLFAEGDEVELSWFNDSEGDYHLYAFNPSDWGKFALDLIHATLEEPWGKIVGAQLVEVELFTHPRVPERCVAVRHVFVRADQKIEVWIGVGARGRMEANDELLALIDRKPDNLDELTLMKTILA